MNDSALLPRLRARDERAFEEVVRTCGPRLMSVARRIVHSDADAADVVQEAFLSAFKALDRFEGNSTIATWLHRITVNAALMKARSRRRAAAVSIEELLPSFLEDGHRRDPRAPWTETPEQLAQRAEIRLMVQAKIDLLPDEFREVLILRDIEGVDTDGCAAALSISAGAVKTRLHRARMALRTLLERELTTPGRAISSPGAVDTQ